jgi:hypothetical protein
MGEPEFVKLVFVDKIIMSVRAIHMQGSGTKLLWLHIICTG